MNPSWGSYAGKAALIHASEEDGTSKAPGIQTAISGIEEAGGTSRCTTTPAPTTRSSTTSGRRSTTPRRPTRRGSGRSRSSTRHLRLSLLPHPATGELFASPVPPGAGWPGDPSQPDTPVAHGADDVRRLARAAPDLADLEARVGVCRACPRLVAWREEVAVTKRRAFAGEPYWGRPVPGWGDERPWLLVVGLAPAAHGGNRTGRVFTGDRSGDWIFAALHRAGLATQAHSVHAARRAAPGRCADGGAGALRAAGQQAHAGRAGHLRAVVRPRGPSWSGRRCGSCWRSAAFAWEVFLGAAARLGWDVPAPRPRFAPRRVGVAARGPPAPPVALLGTYHVSQQNTFTGRLTEPMLDAVLAHARALASGERP